MASKNHQDIKSARDRRMNSKFIFTHQDIPQWNGSSITDLFERSVEHVWTRHVNKDSNKPKIYTNGRTGAKVERLSGSKVFKTNHNSTIDDLECRVYSSLRKANLNVPSAERIANGIVIDYAGNQSFKEATYDPSGIFEPQKLMQRTLPMGTRMAKLISIIDYTIEETLSDEDKKYLQETAVGKVAKRNNVPHEFARKRYWLFRMLEAIPDANQQTVELLLPIEEMMREATKKYGSWTADLHTGNLFPIIEEDEFKDFCVIDFNRIKYGPMQMAGGIAFDLPLSIVGFNSKAATQMWWNLLNTFDKDGRWAANFTANVFGNATPVFFQEREFKYLSDHNINRQLLSKAREKGESFGKDDADQILGSDQIYMTSPYDEMTRRAFTGQRLIKHKELTGEEFEIGEYAIARHGTRVYVNLLQGMYALREAMEATDYPTLFNKFLSVQHHLNLIVYNLEALAKHEGNGPQHYQPLVDHVISKYTQVVQQIPVEVPKYAEAWFKA